MAPVAQRVAPHGVRGDPVATRRAGRRPPAGSAAVPAVERGELHAFLRRRAVVPLESRRDVEAPGHPAHLTQPQLYIDREERSPALAGGAEQRQVGADGVAGVRWSGCPGRLEQLGEAGQRLRLGGQVYQPRRQRVSA